MDIENIAVYESLRNEIIATQETRANLVVYMYTVFAALFALGVEQSKVFFVIASFIVISFQSRINRCKYTIARISAYIKVFFEEERDDIHWESSHTDKTTYKVRLRADNTFVSLLSETGSVQLGVISLVCYFGITLFEWSG